ncbi:MAG: hypothetical protein JSW58_08645 [Candidatus Latescibacterota bacterium]|nr:MAG: hypothetical protein JSW58_08645 [Candidatus Latescibacterota bacterium]
MNRRFFLKALAAITAAVGIRTEEVAPAVGGDYVPDDLWPKYGERDYQRKATWRIESFETTSGDFDYIAILVGDNGKELEVRHRIKDRDGNDLPLSRSPMSVRASLVPLYPRKDTS